MPGQPTAEDDYYNVHKAEVSISRVTSTDPDRPQYYAVTICHRPTLRKFVAELSGEQLALVLTGMGGIYGDFRERILGR